MAETHNELNENETRLFPGLAKQVEEQTGKSAEPDPEAEENVRVWVPKQATVTPMRPLPEDPGSGEPQTWEVDDRHRKRRSKAAAITLLVLLVLFIISLIVGRTVTNWDALRRSYTYRGMARDERGVTDSFALASEVCSVGAMGRQIVTLSTLGIQVLDEDGYERANCVTPFEKPVLRVSEKTALAYDPGKRILCAVNSSMQTKQISTEAPLQAADAAKNGSFCLMTEADTGKTVLHVYSENFSEVFTWYSKSRYLSMAALSDNGQVVATVGVGSRDGGYWSSLLLLQTDREEPIADVSLGDSMVLWVDWIGSSCCLVCTDRILFYSQAGELLGSCKLDDWTVSGIAPGDGYLALMATDDRTGSQSALFTIRTDGTLLGEYALLRTAEQVSAAGSYVAVMTAQGVLVFSEKLQPIAELSDCYRMESCEVRSDGTVLLYDGQSAALYLP